MEDETQIQKTVKGRSARATYALPSVRMHERIVDWIARGAPLDTLRDWIEGWGLPAGQRGADPFYTIWAGLERGSADERRTLASRLGDLLREEPLSEPPRRNPERLLYNALTLSAMLASPKELAGPLLELQAKHPSLGAWLGTDLSQALARAIERNLAEDDLIAALGPRARELDPNPDRRRLFREAISRSIEPAGKREIPAADMIRLASKYSWPGWAVECLPSLFVPLGSHGSLHRVLAWHYILAFLPVQAAYEEIESLCNGHVLCVAMRDGAFHFAQRFASLVEPARRLNPYPDDSTMRAGVEHALEQFTLELRETGDEATAAEIDRLRRRQAPRLSPNLDMVFQSMLKLIGTHGSEPDSEQVMRPLVHPMTTLYGAALQPLAERAEQGEQAAQAVDLVLSLTR